VRGDYDHEFFQGDSNAERRLCAKVMNMHFGFANNIRKNGASWLIDDENATGDKHRTREEAIKEACILLKRSRGREVCEILSLYNCFSADDYFNSCQVYQILFLLVNSSVSTAGHGETLLACISRMYGRRPTHSSSFYFCT
jgi:hypothetical protein